MTFSSTVKRAWNDNRLVSALFELTYACNLNCSFCYNDLSLEGEPLSLAQYKQLLDDLAEMNVLKVTLSGGEPLAHPQFFEIGRHARDAGFVVRIKSNGHALRESMVKRIAHEIEPFVIEVSLHGASAATHDRQTRVVGSFNRLLHNIRGMRALGVRVKVNSTLTQWNEHELEGIFALCDELDVQLQVDTEVKPRDDGDMEPLSIAPSQAASDRMKELLRVRAGALAKPLQDLAQLRDAVFEGTDKHCGAGSSTITVDPYGSVLPCVQWRYPIGNLHRQSIKTIWATSPQLEDVRKTTRAARKMVASHGDLAAAINFCPGAAHTHTGDPLALYPAAQRRMNAAARERVRLPVV